MNVLLWIPMYLLSGLTKLVLAVLGLILIPIAVLFKAYGTRQSKISDHDIKAFTWPIMQIWNNEEDGIVAGQEYLDKPEWYRIIYWSAIRNPVNNLRYNEFFCPMPDPDNVRFFLKRQDRPTITEKHVLSAEGLIDYHTLVALEDYGVFWYFAWQGRYANYRKQFIMPFTFGIPFTKWKFVKGQLIRFWIGFKVYPSSCIIVPKYQEHGIGVSLQLKDVTRHEP